jgi:hypothetical protein
LTKWPSEGILNKHGDRLFSGTDRFTLEHPMLGVCDLPDQPIFMTSGFETK